MRRVDRCDSAVTREEAREEALRFRVVVEEDPWRLMRGEICVFLLLSLLARKDGRMFLNVDIANIYGRERKVENFIQGHIC